jgi:hypothetical protein
VEMIQIILDSCGPHIAALLFAAFLGLLSYWDTIPGRIFLFVCGAALLTTMWLGITL